jgi:hypothetical protein
MQHAYMYHGAFELNFPTLVAGARTYRTSDSQEREIPAWPPDIDGMRVGYMEKRGKKFCAVRVQFDDHDVVLATPVVIDQLRHLGSRRFAPEPTIVGDDLASAMLDEMIERNPELRDELALLINRINEVRRGPRE